MAKNEYLEIKARTGIIKLLTKEILNMGKNSDIEKYERRSHETLIVGTKNFNGKNKSKNITEEYEKKLKSVKEDHDYIKNKKSEIQNEENENMEQLKTYFESYVTELKSNFFQRMN